VTVRELVASLVNASGNFRFKPLKTHHSEQAVIVEARMSGDHRASWAGMEPRGGRMDIRLACVFDFDGDRLANETEYFDLTTLQRQLGSS
jgi:limonene-1,2-epoxide hydrolase